MSAATKTKVWYLPALGHALRRVLDSALYLSVSASRIDNVRDSGRSRTKTSASASRGEHELPFSLLPSMCGSTGPCPDGIAAHNIGSRAGAGAQQAGELAEIVAARQALGILAGAWNAGSSARK
jgi:hypothetical protein